MSEKIKNPWDLAWSKWWVQQNYKKCEVDDMTLSGNTYHGDEEIDTAESLSEAKYLTEEYKIAFVSGNVYFKRI